MRVAVVAPSGRFAQDVAEPVRALAAEHGIDLHIHDQCGRAHGHFAGTDAERLAAFVEVADDPEYDAVWFARGGYGACRIAEAAIAALGPRRARQSLSRLQRRGLPALAGLYRAGFPHFAHGPLAQDVARPATSGGRRASPG
jgi:muramoyltetrapeptide carboxypeptidase